MWIEGAKVIATHNDVLKTIGNSTKDDNLENMNLFI